MRIAFLGTPDFAVPSLKALYSAGHDIAVFSQPDRLVGRHAELRPTAVKACALSLGLPVYQFEKIRSEEGLSALKAFQPDLMVTAAFGQLLSGENLAVPKYGCINVHGSLLPKYRGAAPIQWSVINGDAVTGVTTMMTDIGMDTGDILLVKETPIAPEETAGELYDRLSVLGAELLLETLSALENGTLSRTPQNEEEATKCSMLKKEDGHIDFSKSCTAVHNLVRGVSPWPGAFCLDEAGNVIKIHKSRPVQELELAPGCCLCDPKKGIFIGCGSGAIEVLELQLPGAKRLDSLTFLRGKTLDGKTFR